MESGERKNKEKAFGLTEDSDAETASHQKH